MRNIFFIGFGVVALLLLTHFKHAGHQAPVDTRADDDHPVHIAMGGHDYQIPRYFLVTWSGDDVKLDNVTTRKGPHTDTHVARIDLLAALPDFKPVPDAERHPPFGAQPEAKVEVAIINQPFQPQTLMEYTAALQARKQAFTTVPGPASLVQEDDPGLKGPVATHHYFGSLYGRELMITCHDAPGLACVYDFPLKTADVQVTFARSALPQWNVLYANSVEFVSKLQVN